MEILIKLLFIIALIPASAFCFGQLSHMLQTIFNKNFNEEKHKEKWQLRSPSTYGIMIVGVTNLLNEHFIKNQYLEIYIEVAILSVCYWHLVTLIKHHFFYKKNLI